jgi:hypothetical protein
VKAENPEGVLERVVWDPARRRSKLAAAIADFTNHRLGLHDVVRGIGGDLFARNPGALRRV